MLPAGSGDNVHLWQGSPTLCPKKGTAYEQMWLCNINSQLVCSYGGATSNWTNLESPQLLYFMVPEWGQLRRSEKCAVTFCWGISKASLPCTSSSLHFCFVSALLFSNKSWRALFFFSLCLSWSEPAGVISTSQVFSKTQIEIRFLRFERNVSASYRHFICKHLCQGSVEIAPTDLKCLVNKGSREVNARAGNTQVTRSAAVV